MSGKQIQEATRSPVYSPPFDWRRPVEPGDIPYETCERWAAKFEGSRLLYPIAAFIRGIVGGGFTAGFEAGWGDGSTIVRGDGTTVILDEWQYHATCEYFAQWFGGDMRLLTEARSLTIKVAEPTSDIPPNPRPTTPRPKPDRIVRPR